MQLAVAVTMRLVLTGKLAVLIFSTPIGHLDLAKAIRFCPVVESIIARFEFKSPRPQ